MKLTSMRLVTATIDLLIVSSCALALAYGTGKPAASNDDAGANASLPRDAAAGSGGKPGTAGSAADSSGSDAPAQQDAGPPPSAAGTGGITAGAGGREASGGHVAVEAGAAGQAAAAGSSAAASCERCSAYAPPKQTGSIAPSELSALSGLVMSRSQAEILFAHNDHDRPVVYALDLQGQLHARITLEGAQTSDIEDIAVGPCAAQTCVYLADIGDNAASRTQYSVLRFVEPEVPSSAGSAAMMLDNMHFEQLRFSYEDGSHNAESLLIAPNGNLYLITKLAPGSGGNVEATGPSSVYRIDASAFDSNTAARATKVRTLSIPKSGEGALSAAAAHPCGLGVLVRTYDRVYEFLTPSGADLEAAFSATPQIVVMPNEPQSEAIDYRSDGRGFVTSGEGSAAPIMLTSCAP